MRRSSARHSEGGTATTDYEDDEGGLGKGFWRKLLGGVFLGGMVAAIVFLLIGVVWYAWGFLATLLVAGGVTYCIWYVVDRRRQKQYEEDKTFTESI